MGREGEREEEDIISFFFRGVKNKKRSFSCRKNTSKTKQYVFACMWFVHLDAREKERERISKEDTRDNNKQKESAKKFFFWEGNDGSKVESL